jgi:AhpD family alkylhydroperoxidase
MGDMTTSTTPRIDIARLAGAPVAAMVQLEERIDLDSRLSELVKLRASQINGCAFCIDMHWAALRRDGESEVRLAQVAAWEESPYFDERERAALALTEAVTHVSATHVPDAVWARAEAHFPPEELSHLLIAIAAINLWNRLAVSTRAVPASYAEA